VQACAKLLPLEKLLQDYNACEVFVYALAQISFMKQKIYVQKICANLLYAGKSLKNKSFALMGVQKFYNRGKTQREGQAPPSNST
jgi:hypothetical protein